MARCSRGAAPIALLAPFGVVAEPNGVGIYACFVRGARASSAFGRRSATRGAILALALAGMRTAGIGVAFGLVGSIALTLPAELFFGVGAHDHGTPIPRCWPSR